MRRGLNRRLGMAEGLGFEPIWRGIRRGHARCIVFVPVSLGEMTSGTQMSVVGERERGSDGRGPCVSGVEAGEDTDSVS
jgi:hypothetical protein